MQSRKAFLSLKPILPRWSLSYVFHSKPKLFRHLKKEKKKKDGSQKIKEEERLGLNVLSLPGRKYRRE